MSDPKGISVFYSRSKRCWVLQYEHATLGRPQKLVPREIATERAAQKWALEWLAAQGLRPAEVIEQRRELERFGQLLRIEDARRKGVDSSACDLLEEALYYDDRSTSGEKGES